MKGKAMKLHIDALTAATAIDGLARRGNDLVILAQAVDEEYRRFAVDPKTGTRHLVTTMANRQESPPTGLPYHHTSFLQPDPIPAEQRDIKDRFLKGKPLLCAEIALVDDGYRLDVAVLKMGQDVFVTIDRANGKAAFYLENIDLPESTRMALIGRSIGEVVGSPILDTLEAPLEIQALRDVDVTEMQGVRGSKSKPGIAIETRLPEWHIIEFDPVYAGRMHYHIPTNVRNTT